ncbi:MAG TPA: hypothetical protein VJ579_04460 [Candidatus Paceibacterota bacterium]|nr:hypothetical protein [Candidatus Paceibacterota bacterium]
MSFDQLKNFVTTQRLSGVSDENIKIALREKHWREDLIAKSFEEEVNPPRPTSSELDLSTKLLTVGELVPAAWNLFMKNAKAYMLCSFATMLAVLLTIALFVAPIIYDVFVLRFTFNDFTSSSVLPILILHSTIGLLSLIIVSLWGTLALYTIVAHEGEMTVRHAFKRAWERLPGFFLIGILTTLITLAGFIVFFIPGLIFSVYLSFASLAYVVHGSRGKAALLSSLTLVHGRWWKTFWRILSGGVLAYCVSVVASSILPGLGAIIAKIVLSPMMLAYMYVIYQNYMAFDKAHPKEEVVDAREIEAEVHKSEN